MTGVEGIPDDVLERAVEAAARANYEVLYGNSDRHKPWDETLDDFRGVFRSDVRPLVTAALAEVAPLVTAETAKPAIDYCLERGYTLLYTANGPEPAMCVRLAVRDVNMLRAEVEALRAVLEGRCLADITLRDEEHRQAVCILAKGHETMHDDGMGTTWSDGEHWQPTGFDAANAEIERLQNVADAAEEQVEALRATVARVEKVSGRMARHAEGADPYWTAVGICGREVMDALRGESE